MSFQNSLTDFKEFKKSKLMCYLIHFATTNCHYSRPLLTTWAFPTRQNSCRLTSRGASFTLNKVCRSKLVFIPGINGIKSVSEGISSTRFSLSNLVFSIRILCWNQVIKPGFHCDFFKEIVKIWSISLFCPSSKWSITLERVSYHKF